LRGASSSCRRGLRTAAAEVLSEGEGDHDAIQAAFQLMETPEYLRHGKEFRRHAEALRQAAQTKNLDGATLAYVQLTLNCVNCH
jgi:hypothetical protein